MIPPWAPQTLVLGLEGLDLKRDLRQVAPTKLTRQTNLRQLADGALTVRPGQTPLATTGAASVHSIARLNNPALTTYTRLWGADATLYRGQSGVLAALEAGFSGDPLAFVPYRPPLSGESWMFVADSLKMRKVRASDGLTLPVGLSAPPAACTTALGPELLLPAEEFEAGFTGYAGTGGAPALTYPAGKSTNCLQLAVNAGAAIGGYYSFADKPVALDLSSFGGGVDVTDDDLLHLWLYVDRPDRLVEIRVYFICSTFSPGNLPGASSSAGLNTDSYVKAFRPSDITGMIDQTQSSYIASDLAARREAIEQAYRQYEIDQDISIFQSLSVAQEPGAFIWHEYGVVGMPLRRSEFLRVGTDDACDWSTITGICVVVQTANTGAVVARFDDCYFRGGRALDTAEPGSSPYDYRTTNYDPRTGAESNPSLVQATADYLDSLRRSIVVTPAAYGDADMRQRAYRRGGSLTDDWYYVGINAADGGAITDIDGDLAIADASTVALNHDQPMNTLDSAGATVAAQPVPCLWGPVQDLLFACGDPYRPGDVYWPLAGQPDHWPAANHVEVCAPSEELMNGCVYGGQSWVFSRLGLYQLIPNLSAAGGVTGLPTACKKGLIARWAFCVGTGGIYFVSTDGIYVTAGGEAVNLTDNDVRGLFHGETRSGYLPVDLTDTTALRLCVHDNELRFLYKDSAGAQQELILNLLTRRWRHHTYAYAVACLYSENEGDALTLLMGGDGLGIAYTHDGLTDDQKTILWNARTGALDQGAPRAQKTYGDLGVEVDAASTLITVQVGLDAETVVLAAQTLPVAAGRAIYRLQPFGTEPRHGSSISIDLSGASDGPPPTLYLLHLSAALQPELTGERVSLWENAGSPFEKYILGCTFEYDTGGVDKPLVIEGRLEDGATVTLDTLTVNANGRHTRTRSWPAVKATMVRIRPSSDVAWLLYDLSWLAAAEPPRVAYWDSLFTLESTFADKWVKGVLLDCDTFGNAKTVEVYGDGVLQTTLTVTANGRRALHFAFPQFRARVLRLKATDDSVGLLYGREWIFDIEPYALTRWESQEVSHGMAGWHTLLRGDIAVRSSAPVTLTLTAYRQDGTSLASTYTLPSTAGVKQILSVPFEAQKGVLYKYLFTCASAWWLYREESTVLVQSCQGGPPQIRHPFGNDDLDPTRGMSSAMGAAARSGGSL